MPQDQDKKLALIADANNLLGPTIVPFDVLPSPSDADTSWPALAATAAKLRDAAKGDDAPSQDARRLAAALEAVVKVGPAARARADAALVPGLKSMLAQVAASLTAQRVTLDDHARRSAGATGLPQDGTARIQVSPKDTRDDPEVLARFTDAVRKVAPAATGAPISILESGKTIVGAFIEAGVLSFIAITILLFITLRRLFDVLMTLAPLLLTGLLTPGDLRRYRPEAELRQCHRPAVAARYRRRVQHLFRGGMAGRGQKPASI